MVSTSDLLGALHVLNGLASPKAARTAAESLPDHLAVVDLLRAADGVQALARAHAARRVPEVRTEHDPHDIRRLYT